MSKPAFNPNGFNLQTNVCIQVDEFDLNAPHGGYAKGTVLAPGWMEGQSVAVRLMDEAECVASFRANKDAKANRKFFSHRPTVAKFEGGFKVGTNSIPPMQVGGILMCHGATRDLASSTDALKVWKAQYMESYAPGPGRSVIHGVARVEVREHGGATRAHVDVLSPTDAKLVGSLQDIHAFYTKCMDGCDSDVGVPHVSAIKQPIALLRLISDEGAKSRFLYAPAVKKDVVDNDGNSLTISVPSTPVEAFNAAFVEGSIGKGFFRMVGAALDDGLMAQCPAELQQQARELREGLVSRKISIEIMPGMRVPVVGKSLDDLLVEGDAMDKAAQKCWTKVSDGQGGEKDVLGFVKMTVGLMLGRSSIPGLPANLIVTKFTEDEFAKARTPDFIATKDYSPAFTQAREHEAAQRAEEAAAKGGVEASSFDQEAAKMAALQAQADAEAEKRAQLESSPAPGM